MVKRFVQNDFQRAVHFFAFAYSAQAAFYIALTQTAVFPVIAGSLFLIRICGGIIIPLSTYLVQVSTDDSIRGRVFTVYNSSYVAVMQVSHFASGQLFLKYGIATIGAIGGTASLLCGLVWSIQMRMGEFTQQP